MNLKSFQEIPVGDSVLVPGMAQQVYNIKQEFLRQVAYKNLNDITQTTEHYEGKEYIVFVKSFGYTDKAAFAFHIGNFGSQDLVIETRVFELATSSRVKNQAMGFMGVMGNIAKGFLSPSGRSWSDEKDLFSKMGQAVTGRGVQGLGEQARRESQIIFQSLVFALQTALEQI